MNARTDEMAKVIEMAVEESGKTCERCCDEEILYEQRSMRVRREGCRRADEVEGADEVDGVDEVDGADEVDRTDEIHTGCRAIKRSREQKCFSMRGSTSLTLCSSHRYDNVQYSGRHSTSHDTVNWYCYNL